MNTRSPENSTLRSGTHRMASPVRVGRLHAHGVRHPTRPGKHEAAPGMVAVFVGIEGCEWDAPLCRAAAGTLRARGS